MWTRGAALLSGLALLAFLASALWLGRLERGGPAHVDVALEGGVPATLYLPVEGEARREAFFDPPPRDQRPPALVLAHGFGADRRFASGLARRLAGAGYAVLTPDLRGHGANRNPFQPSWGRPDFLYDEFAAAVDFLRVSPFVDGTRLAVMGHSMGGGAALDYATRDSGLDAAVMIAGGLAAVGPYAPPNSLFVYAEREIPFIAQRVRVLAAELAGVDAIDDGKGYGDLARGTGVRAVEVPGTSHGSVLWSRAAAGEIVQWLDAAFGRPGDHAPGRDPRPAAAALVFAAALLVLPGLGLAVGRLVPPQRPLPDARRGLALVVLAVVLLAALPPLALGGAGAVLSLEAGAPVFVHLALAGVALWVLLVLTRAEWQPALRRPLASLAGAGVALVGVYALLHPPASVFAELAPTPERALLFAVAALALAPFALAFQVLLRRGRPVAATAFCVAGRLVVLGVLVLGAAAGVLNPLAFMVLAPLLGVFVLSEIVSSVVYATSRNLAAIAFFEAAFLAWVVAALMPVRI